MWVILKVDHSLVTMITTSSSEPVLFIVLTQPDFNPPQALEVILAGFAVNKGELGELIVLLFTMACDLEAVGLADQFG